MGVVMNKEGANTIPKIKLPMINANSKSMFRKLIKMPRHMSFINCGKGKENVFPVNTCSVLSDKSANKGERMMSKMYFEKVAVTNHDISFMTQVNNT